MGSSEARPMKSTGKLVGMLGTGVLTLTLGCAISVRAQEQGQQQQEKDEMKKPASYQQAKLEQPQSGQRFQYTSTSGVGLIPNDRFRAHFGREHKFHLTQSAYGKDRRFQYGGYSFGFVDEWPVNWLPAQDLFPLPIYGRDSLSPPPLPCLNPPLNLS